MEAVPQKTNRKSVSVVIPTLNPGLDLSKMLSALLGQHPVPPDEIIVVDSGSVDGTLGRVREAGEKVRLIEITNFTHGRSRNIGVQAATGDVIVFLSQDAIPKDPSWLNHLLDPYDQDEIAATFSRQEPKPDANPMETYFLHTHFPKGNEIRIQKRKGETLQFHRDVFFSNVSSSARRSVLLEYPFDEDLIMSEDQQFARDVILAGMSVAYVPMSVVVHSHDYSFRQALGRYFDSIYSLRQIFPKHDFGQSLNIGLGYLWKEFLEIALHHPLIFPRYILYVMAKTMGTLLGHIAEKLPVTFARRISMHTNWWPSDRAT